MSGNALVAAMAEMYFQGVSTRKVKAITENLFGPSGSPAKITGAEGGRGGALPGAGVELANRESRSSLRECRLAPKRRRLSGVE